MQLVQQQTDEGQPGRGVTLYQIAPNPTSWVFDTHLHVSDLLILIQQAVQIPLACEILQPPEGK
jgi:hypothetical protein